MIFRGRVDSQVKMRDRVKRRIHKALARVIVGERTRRGVGCSMPCVREGISTKGNCFRCLFGTTAKVSRNIHIPCLHCKAIGSVSIVYHIRGICSTPAFETCVIPYRLRCKCNRFTCPMIFTIRRDTNSAIARYRSSKFIDILIHKPTYCNYRAPCAIVRTYSDIKLSTFPFCDSTFQGIKSTIFRVCIIKSIATIGTYKIVILRVSPKTK